MSDTTIHDQMGKNGFVWFHGVVEDIKDPLKMGRVRVRCFEFHNADKELLPTNDLPWATVLQPATSAAVSGKGTSPTGLLAGSWVIGFFRDGVNCQDPVILGSFAGFPDPIEGTTGEYSDPKLGFNDPEGKWPSKNYGGEPDTNRLARNEKIERTIVQKKRDETLAGIQTALHPWLTWDEKPTEYAAEYPKNHVIETESGHVIELDDTPNKERIGIYHKAGTWIEVHPDGSKVQKTRGDDYEIALSDKKLLVKGNCYMNMDGAITTLKAGRDFYIEIGGDVHMFARGNVVMETGKNFEHRVHGTYTVASDGNMAFVAPRIDFNPEGVAPELASSPMFAGGKNIPPLFSDATVFPGRTLNPLDVVVNGINKEKYLSTDYFKKLNLQGSQLPTGLDAFKSYYGDALPNTNPIPWDQTAKETLTKGIPVKGDQWWKDIPADKAVAATPSTLPQGTVTKTQNMPSDLTPTTEEVASNNSTLLSQTSENNIQQTAISQKDSVVTTQAEANYTQQNQELAQMQAAQAAQAVPTQAPQLTVMPGAIQEAGGGGFPLLQDEVGGFLSGIGAGANEIVGGVAASLPEGLNLGGLAGVGAGTLLGGALGSVGSVVGGAFAGLLVFTNPAAAIQAVNIGANVSTATVPSPSSYASSTPQDITNLSATPLPPVASGIAGQSIADTNLVNIGAPAIPTESLYAVPGGKATLISGYPGRSDANSATKGIPAIPVVAFESQFPSMKQPEITEVDGGEF